MFYPYQHVEKFERDDVEGIDLGTCFVFPKIDGTNSSVWLQENQIHCGSRKREISEEKDNAGFYKFIQGDSRFNSFLLDYPEWTLFGEWLVPHTLKTYIETAWNKFYVFDIYDRQNNKYISYLDYKPILEKYNIDYIPVQAIIKNPNKEQLYKEVENNIFLIKENCGFGEGIVIKNYNFTNKYGRVTWAKIVTNDFKAKHWKQQPTEKKGKEAVENKIIEQFFRRETVEKIFASMKIEGFSSKRIPELLNRCWHDFIQEEIWIMIKKYKNPIIDFKKLSILYTMEIKKQFPEIF
jgi:hypothetical protein